MLPRLIIISDLFGFKNTTYQNIYLDLFSKDFNVQLYDSCYLAEINENQSEENIHAQFLEFGIDKAVTKITTLERTNISVLAFSIGGTIAWKAALSGLAIDALYCVSATRLRYETQIPKCKKIQLFYGDNDIYTPKEQWFKKMKITPFVFENEHHTLYTKRKVAEFIHKKITS